MPVRTGRRDNCLFRIDTRGDIGLVYVEAPGERDLTLGQFFHIYKQPPSSTHLLERTADAYIR